MEEKREGGQRQDGGKEGRIDIQCRGGRDVVGGRRQRK